MRVLVCGGRDYNRYVHVYDTLGALQDSRGRITHLIAGGATGADYWGESWGRMNKSELLIFPADWKAHGKKAGYLRNVQMLEEGKPDVVLAFPGGRGTEMMKRLAKDAGVEVIDIGPFQKRYAELDTD